MSSGDLCSGILSFIFMLVTTLVFFLPNNKSPSIHLLAIRTSNNSDITYGLEIKKRNPLAGLEYEDIVLSLWDKNDTRASTIQSFYQGWRKTAVKSDVLEGGWNPRNQSVRVRLKGSYKIKSKLWGIFTITSRDRKHVNVFANDVKVDEDGNMNPTEKIKLVSSRSYMVGVSDLRFLLAVGVIALVVIGF